MDISADDQALDALAPTPTGSDAGEATDSLLRPLTVATLNHLLSQELVAAEACRAALATLAQLPVATVLRQVLDGHHVRAGVLFEAIRNHGSQPDAAPGQDDPVVSAATTDVRAVLAHLLAVEQHGVAVYRQSLNQLDNLTRTMVEADLLSGQETALATIAGAQPPSPDGAV